MTSNLKLEKPNLLMNASELRTKVLEEIQRVPEDKLVELYNLIHSFRLGEDTESNNTETIMQFASCWSTLPDDTYAEFLDEIALRRQQGFSERRNREASLD